MGVEGMALTQTERDTMPSKTENEIVALFENALEVAANEPFDIRIGDSACYKALEAASELAGAQEDWHMVSAIANNNALGWSASNVISRVLLTLRERAEGAQ